MQARTNDESKLLACSKPGFNELMLSYPEQNDIILTNLLNCYGLTRDGQESAMGNSAGQGDEGVLQMREELKVCSVTGACLLYTSPSPRD